MRGRPNCDAHSPANRFEPCNNSTTCVEYSLNGTVATACLALLEGDCLSVPMFTYPCSVSGRRLHSRRPPCHLTPRTVREKHGEDTGRQWMQRSQRWWWKRDKRRDGEATRREDSRQARRRRTQSKEVDRKKTTEEADRGGGSRRSERRWECYHRKEFCQRVTTDQCLLKLL